MKEYDIEPKQAWRLAERLLHDVTYDRGIEEKNEWVYASSESEMHQQKFLNWIGSKGIGFDEKVWILISYPAEETRETEWREFISRWPEFFSDTDLKVTNKSFSWILEYKSQRVARFGRKQNIQRGSGCDDG